MSAIQLQSNSTRLWDATIEPLLGRIARSDVPVLIVGETGAGKDFIARRIHALSPRAAGKFIKLTCATLSTDIVDRLLGIAELSRTHGDVPFDQRTRRTAIVGTLLLDEVGELDLRLQATLLQALGEEHVLVRQVRDEIRLDLRIIVTTGHNLEHLVAAGKFREDLFFRLKVVGLSIPPLRDRKHEIVPLALSMLTRLTPVGDPPPELGPHLAAALVRHHWPGNVRELENVMRSYVIVRDQDYVLEELRHVAVRRVSENREACVEGNPPGPAASVAGTPLARVDEARRQAETALILRTLTTTFWNRKRAATALGMDYRALLYKMRKLGIMQGAERAETDEITRYQGSV